MTRSGRQEAHHSSWPLPHTALQHPRVPHFCYDKPVPSSQLTSLLSFVNFLSFLPISPWRVLFRPSPFFSLSPRYATKSLHLRKEHNPAWVLLTIDQLYLSLFLGLVPLNETVQTEVIPVVRYPPRQPSDPPIPIFECVDGRRTNLLSPSSHSTRLLSSLAISLAA